MTRVFSLDFPYQQQTYTAMVMLSGAEGSQSIHICVPHASLGHLLPRGGVISYSEEKGLDLPGFTVSRPAWQLMQSLIDSIEGYIGQAGES